MWKCCKQKSSTNCIRYEVGVHGKSARWLKTCQHKKRTVVGCTPQTDIRQQQQQQYTQPAENSALSYSHSIPSRRVYSVDWRNPPARTRHPLIIKCYGSKNPLTLVVCEFRSGRCRFIRGRYGSVSPERARPVTGGCDFLPFFVPSAPSIYL